MKSPSVLPSSWAGLVQAMLHVPALKAFCSSGISLEDKMLSCCEMWPGPTLRGNLNQKTTLLQPNPAVVLRCSMRTCSISLPGNWLFLLVKEPLIPARLEALSRPARLQNVGSEGVLWRCGNLSDEPSVQFMEYFYIKNICFFFSKSDLAHLPQCVRGWGTDSLSRAPPWRRQMVWMVLCSFISWKKKKKKRKSYKP